jgi:hypothetical protein
MEEAAGCVFCDMCYAFYILLPKPEFCTKKPSTRPSTLPCPHFLKSSIPSNTTAKAFFGITKPFLVVLRMCSGVRVPQPKNHEKLRSAVVCLTCVFAEHLGRPSTPCNPCMRSRECCSQKRNPCRSQLLVRCLCIYSPSLLFGHFRHCSILPAHVQRRKSHAAPQ